LDSGSFGLKKPWGRRRTDIRVRVYPGRTTAMLLFDHPEMGVKMGQIVKQGNAGLVT